VRMPRNIEQCNLSELTDAAELWGACGPELEAVQSFGDMKTLLRNACDDDKAFWAYWCARVVFKRKRWVAGEKYILRSPAWSYNYALLVLRGRWVAGESIIAQSPRHKGFYEEQFNCEIKC